MKKKNDMPFTLIGVVFGLLIGAALGNVSVGFLFGILLGNAVDKRNETQSE